MEDAPETIELDMEGFRIYIRRRYRRRASEGYGRNYSDAMIEYGVDVVRKKLASLSSLG